MAIVSFVHSYSLFVDCFVFFLFNSNKINFKLHIHTVHNASVSQDLSGSKKDRRRKKKIKSTITLKTKPKTILKKKKK